MVFTLINWLDTTHASYGDNGGIDELLYVSAKFTLKILLKQTHNFIVDSNDLEFNLWILEAALILLNQMVYAITT